MVVRRPRPEYLSVRSSKTLDPVIAVREDPVETVAESDKLGGFQLIEEEHRNIVFICQPGLVGERMHSGSACMEERPRILLMAMAC